MVSAPLCCGGPARLTSGAEVYPHRPELAEKAIWKCDPCGAYVGCHPNSTTPLGTPAGRDLRFRRGAVHRKLDPLWQRAHLLDVYRDTSRAVQRGIRNVARKRCYAWLADQMGLTADQCHVGMFTLGQCSQALAILDGVAFDEIRDWARRQESAARDAADLPPPESLSAA